MWELVMNLSLSDQHRINAAIKAAEAKTSGEIVGVIAGSSSDYMIYPIGWAALGALLAPWILIALTHLSVQRIFLIQLVVFVSLFLCLSTPWLRPFLVPRRVQRRQAHRAAMEQFMIRGMARKHNRAGVLIFVSLTEHYARIVADDGIAAKVTQTVWQEAIDGLLEHIREGRIADGFLSAIEKCSAVLATHFPPGETQDELPDRVYVI
jgi:putative membrane protein